MESLAGEPDMSLTEFRPGDMKIAANRRRHAPLDKGQLIRTLVLFVICVVAVTLIARQSHAAESHAESPGIVAAGP